MKGDSGERPVSLRVCGHEPSACPSCPGKGRSRLFSTAPYRDVSAPSAAPYPSRSMCGRGCLGVCRSFLWNWVKSSFSGCRSQVAPLEGEGGQEMSGEGGDQLLLMGPTHPRHNQAGRGGHPPAKSRARQGPLTGTGARSVRPGGGLRSPHLSSTLLYGNAHKTQAWA